jgi:hypothetical protein
MGDLEQGLGCNPCFFRVNGEEPHQGCEKENRNHSPVPGLLKNKAGKLFLVPHGPDWSVFAWEKVNHPGPLAPLGKGATFVLIRF